MKVAGKRIGDVLNKIHVAQPKPRDGVRPGSRPAVIPAGVAEARARRAAGEVKKTERDMQEEHGGAGGGWGGGVIVNRYCYREGRA